MSRQSKNAKNLARARDMSAKRKNGETGPARTSPQHGKKNAWWQVGNGSYTDFVKGGKKNRQTAEA